MLGAGAAGRYPREVSAPESLDRSAIAGLLIDLDGTVWEDGAALPGAVEALGALGRAGVPYRFITNTTRKPRGALAAELVRLGVEAGEEEVLNAPYAAALWLAGRGHRRVWPLVAEQALIEFDGFTIDRRRPDAVVIGDLGSAWTFEILDDVFRAVHGGAELAALQRNRYWRTGGRLTLDAGPFVAAIEYATGREAVLVGKPSTAYFAAGVAALALPADSIAMVGDDLEADVSGARAAGLRAVAVRTGKFEPEDEARAAETADAVLDGLGDLPGWLGIAP